MVYPCIDRSGKTLRISGAGLLKIDGVPMCRVIHRIDGCYLQVIDNNRARCEARGTNVIEVKLDAIINLLLGKDGKTPIEKIKNDAIIS